MSSKDLEELRGYSSCEVADGLQKLNINGYLPDIVLYSPEYCAGNAKIVGFAHTVKMVPLNPNLPSVTQHHVDAAKDGDVIVFSTPGGPNAVWGGLMAARAQFLGVKGVVIDGRCRDLEELRVSGFPVFAKGVSTLGAGKHVQLAAIGEPITISDVQISQGDIIVGDLNGVVTFPQAKLKEVLQAIKTGVDADAKCMEDIKKGRTIKESFAEHRGKKK